MSITASDEVACDVSNATIELAVKEALKGAHPEWVVNPGGTKSWDNFGTVVEGMTIAIPEDEAVGQQDPTTKSWHKMGVGPDGRPVKKDAYGQRYAKKAFFNPKTNTWRVGNYYDNPEPGEKTYRLSGMGVDANKAQAAVKTGTKAPTEVFVDAHDWGEKKGEPTSAEKLRQKVKMTTTIASTIVTGVQRVAAAAKKDPNVKAVDAQIKTAIAAAMVAMNSGAKSYTGRIMLRK